MQRAAAIVQTHLFSAGRPKAYTDQWGAALLACEEPIAGPQPRL